jgi:hypothetical protein
MRRELCAVLILAACNSGRQSPAADNAETRTAAPAEAADPGASFRVAVAPPASCVAGGECEARIELTALGDYKVNDEYPFKFVADPDLGVAIDGSGTFDITGAKTGTMTIQMRPAATGSERVSGVFKLSVCTPENCLINEPKIAFDLRVTPSS